MAHESTTWRTPQWYARHLCHVHALQRLSSALGSGRVVLQTTLWLFAAVAWASDLGAGELTVAVKDAQGKPVAKAVVSAELIEAPEASSAGGRGTLTIAQKNEQFEPFVSVVQTGTAVAFPNQDEILHNVYSFSKAKKFQLPLYREQAPAPVVFDQPGTVILGCNIHDWMVAYVYVVDTPYFGKTSEDGTVNLSNLPAGRYRVQVQHPRKRKRGSTPAQTIAISQQAVIDAEFSIALKPEWRPKKRATHTN